MLSRTACLVAALVLSGLAWSLDAATQSKDKVVVKRMFTEGAAKTCHLVAKLVKAGTRKDILAEMTITSKCVSLEKDTGANMAAEFTEFSVSIDWRDITKTQHTPPVVKYVLDNNGNCGKLTTDVASDEAKLAKLLVAVLCVPLPPDGIAPGDKWKVEPKEGVDLGVPGTHTYEFAGLEDVPTVAKALKVRYSFKGVAAGDAKAIDIKGNMWLDPKTGDLVVLKADVTDFILNNETLAGTVAIQPNEKKSASP